MAETSKKVSELETAAQVNNTDLVMLSQGSSGSGFASLKTTILAIAQKIVSGINFTSDLQTESKTITGAINEVAQGGGGSSTFAGLSDVDIDDTTLANGQVPIWDGTEEKWKNGNGGGGTTVIANPTGTPTDDLNSIQIGSDIYRIVGGGGGGGTAKALVMKTMTWTGDGQVSKSITFDEKPLAIFNIWGAGEGSNIYCLNSPFVYGETNYFISSYSGGIIIPSVTYSNDGLTMTMSGADAGYAFNCANAPYTMWYIVEEEVGGGGSASYKEVTGILTAGDTEITLSDSSITENSTFEPFTNKFGVNPTDMEFVSGTETVLQPLVTQESELLGTVTVASTFSDYLGWKAFTSAGSWVGTGNIDQWLAYEFPTDVTVSAIQWHCDDTSRRGIVTSIQYSNDGTTWNDCTLSTNERGNVEISSVNNAKHWRLFFASPFGSWQEPMISNLEFIAVVNGVKLTFPVQSENLNVKVRVS